MAAAINQQLRTYLNDVVGLADNFRSEAVMLEGIDSFDALADFSDDDIKTVCNSVRKPGGVLVMPNGNVAPNPGINIPAICETRLVLAAYGAKLYNLIGRPIDGNTLSAARLRELRRHRETVAGTEDADTLPTISRNFGIMKALDAIPNIFRQMLGVHKVPLSYVIRKDATPGPIQPLDVNVPWSTSHTNVMDELIEYAPHTGPAFNADNATVFRKLSEMLNDTSYATSLKPFQRRRDGRGAYMALQQHNMGDSKWDKIIEAAEDMVQRRTWNGKNSRYPLRIHVSKHREAHNEMVRASQFVAYAPPNGHTRVSRLLKSIECNDPSIAAAKTTILANTVKRDDFEQAADFLLLAAPTKHNQPTNNHRVSMVETGSVKRKGKVQTGKTGVEFRYYKKREFHQLSKEQKDELDEYRRHMKEKEGDDNPPKKKKQSHKQRIAALQAQLEEQAQKIASLETHQDPALPPAPTTANPPQRPQGILRNPLQPPNGFTQRGGN